MKIILNLIFRKDFENLVRKNYLELFKKQTILVFALSSLSNVILEPVSYKSTQNNFHFNVKNLSLQFTLTKYLQNSDDECIFFSDLILSPTRPDTESLHFRFKQVDQLSEFVIESGN